MIRRCDKSNNRTLSNTISYKQSLLTEPQVLEADYGHSPARSQNFSIAGQSCDDLSSIDVDGTCTGGEQSQARPELMPLSPSYLYR